MQIEVIDPKKTAMIVVDMQNDFVAAGAAMETPAARAVVPKLAEALKLCREAGIKIIYTAHVHRRDGSDMGLFDDMHPPIANRDALVNGTPVLTSTRSWRQQLANMSSRSIATAAFLARTWTLSCASGEWIPSSSPGRPRRIAVTPRRATRCFATIESSFYPTRPLPTTIQIEDLARCRTPTSITQCW